MYGGKYQYGQGQQYQQQQETMQPQQYMQQQPGPPSMRPQQHAYQTKFEKIANQRKESKAALTQSQLKGLDISPSLAGPRVMDELNNVLQGAPAAAHSSFEDLPNNTRGYMSGALSSGECITVSTTVQDRQSAVERLEASIKRIEESNNMIESTKGRYKCRPGDIGVLR